MNAEEQMYLVYLLKKYTSEDPLENYWIGSTIKILEKKAHINSASVDVVSANGNQYTFEVFINEKPPINENTIPCRYPY